MTRATLALAFLAGTAFVYGLNVHFLKNVSPDNKLEVMTSAQLREQVLQQTIREGKDHFTFTTDQPPPPMQAGGSQTSLVTRTESSK